MSVSKYDSWTAEVAEALFRRGADDAVVAEVLGVTRRTLTTWRKRHPEFREASAGGKVLANARVESALYRKAVGETLTVQRLTKNGDVVTLTQQVPGDLGAQMAWLCNRDPENWRHVNRIELSGPEGAPMQFEELAKDARERLTRRIAGIAAARGANEISGEPQ